MRFRFRLIGGGRGLGFRWPRRQGRFGRGSGLVSRSRPRPSVGEGGGDGERWRLRPRPGPSGSVGVLGGGGGGGRLIGEAGMGASRVGDGGVSVIVMAEVGEDVGDKGMASIGGVPGRGSGGERWREDSALV